MTSADLDSFQTGALKTAIYPPESGLAYTGFGLFGEIGEFAAGVLQSLERHDFSEAPHQFTAEEYESLRAELGDICWYIATLAHEVGIKLSEIPVAPIRVADPASDATLRMAAEAGAIANKLKKVIRDGRPIESVRANVIAALAIVIACVAHLAKLLGTSMAEVCAENQRKLLARQDRGTLSGDGDKR